MPTAPQIVSRNTSFANSTEEARRIIDDYASELEASGLNASDQKAQLETVKSRTNTRMFALDDSTDPSGLFRKVADEVIAAVDDAVSKL